MNNRLIRYLIGIAIVLPILLHGSWLRGPSGEDWKFEIRLLNELEYYLYDSRIRYSAAEGIDPRVVIVDIDETSLAELGQWPWKRDVLARIVDNLFDQYQVEVLGFDSVFAEPDSEPLFDELKSAASEIDHASQPKLSKLLDQPTRDQQFADAVARHNVVTGYAFGSDISQVNIGKLPAPLFTADTALYEHTSAPIATRYTANLPVLQQDLPGGFFSLFDAIDDDGIIRRAPLLTRYDGDIYPALSLVAAAQYLGLDISPLLSKSTSPENYAQLEALDLGLHSIDIDQQSSVYIPYRRSVKSFHYIPATDIYHQKVANPGLLAGTIALLGTSAAGLVDNRATPVDPIFPGVEIHANVIAGLMDGEFKSHPGWAEGLERVLLLITGLLLVFILPAQGILSMTLITVVVVAGHTAFNFLLWNRYDFLLTLAPLLSACFLVYLFNMIYGYLIESRSRQQLKQSFGLYVPPQIIEKMQGQATDQLLRSEKKEMTVLFTDIRGFTTISEQLSPEDLSQLMNAFLTPMTGIVHHCGGAIDKYMGDAMMAFWGAPIDDQYHAQHGVEAALEMIEALEELNQQFATKGWPEIRIGVGLNTGPMSVGNMGSAFRMAYTVLGDAVNLGSRLEGLTAQYGVPILFAETTAKQSPDIRTLEIDQVRVKGKNEPVRIFTALGATDKVSEAQIARADKFSDALTHYRAQQWDEAGNILQDLLAEGSEKLYQVYLERIDFFRQSSPPQDWDGVFDFKTK